MVTKRQGTPAPQTGTARRVSKLESRRRAAESARAAALQDRPLLSAEAAARYLDVSKWTIYRLIEANQLKAHTVGTRIKIKPEDLDAYLDGCAS